VSIEEIEAAFRGIFLYILNNDQEKRGGCAVSIDGKAHRGRLKFEEEHGYPVHAVSMVEHQTGIVLTQGHVEKTDVETTGKQKSKSKLTGEKEQDEQEEKKQKSELAVASRLIQHIDWQGKVLTG
jgi:hypothetical protein